MDIDTIALLIYIAGCMVVLVPTARFILKMDGGWRDLDTEDYALAAVMSICFVWAWPLYIPGWWIVQVLKTDKDAK